MITVSVPGSILLLGEYCILEPGMHGLSLAVEPRLILTAEPSQKWTIVAKGPNEPACFTIENIGAALTPTIQQISGFSWTNAGIFVKVLEQFIMRQAINPFLDSEPYTITIDSSKLFHDNKKLGLGSSAGVVIVFSAFLFLLLQKGKLHKEQLLDFCIPVHKLVQNGSGSGYDVLTSIEGGLLFFSMSEYQQAQKYFLDAFDAEIWCAMNEVKTASAIRQYELYKKKHPILTKIFWNKTQSFVNAAYGVVKSMQKQSASLFTLSREQPQYHELLALLRKAGKNSARFGRAIGVPADFPRASAALIKSLGAGNEMALAEPRFLDADIDTVHGDHYEAAHASVITTEYSTKNLYVFPCKPAQGIEWEFS